MPDRPASVVFDRIAHEYDATRGGEERGRAVAPALARRLPAAGPIVEIGVGTGVVAASLRANGVPVVGVDLSPSMLRKAFERLGPRLALGDALRLPLASRLVAGAYAVWVLHLVADVRTVFAEVRRILRPGGTFLVVPSAPLERSTDVHVLTRELAERLRPPQDLPERLVQLAARVGLAVSARDSFETHVHEVTPREAAEQIDRRIFSALWDVDEATWQAEVVPMLARIRALPDQDKPRLIRNTYPLLAFRAPRDDQEPVPP